MQLGHLRKLAMTGLSMLCVFMSIGVQANVIFDTGPPGTSNAPVRNYSGIVISRAASFNFSGDATVSSISTYMGAYLGRTGTMTYALYTGGGLPTGSALYSGTFALTSSPDWNTLSGLNWAITAGAYTLEISAGAGAWALLYTGAPQTPDSLTTTYTSHSAISSGAWTVNGALSTYGIRIESTPTSGAPEIDGKHLPQVLLLIGGACLLYKRRERTLHIKTAFS